MISLERNQENNNITIASKKLKYIGTNLMKEVKDLYNENQKSLKKTSMKTLEDERTSHVHGSAESIL
jgi:hypothetical protein